MAKVRASTICALALAALGATGAAEARERGVMRRAAPVKSGFEINDNTPRFFTISQIMAKKAAGEAQAKGAPVEFGALRLATLGGELDYSTLLRARTKEPFASRGFEMFPSINATLAAQWSGVKASWNTERAALEACENDGKCSRAASAFVSIKRQAEDLDGEAQVALVNARVNAAIRYQNDFARHGVADLWSSPLKTLGAAGDCEDYAIAKFFLLRELGVSEDALRIVLVKDRKAGEDHAILAVRAAFGWHLLDNRTNTIESDATMPHYRPVIALNSEKLDLFAAPYVELDDSLFKQDILPASNQPEAVFEAPALRGTLE